MLVVYVDADACPVKEEIYRVARRYELKVILVAVAWMRTPDEPWLELMVVDEGFDAADDWIAEHVEADDIVITDDIPLADRCLKKHARVLRHRGKIFSEDDIGQAMGNRELMSHLRDTGLITGGPTPFEQRDRSRFLQSLDQVIQKIRRKK